eukprot:GHVT01049211.1.p1 GENE.GHVT01049211.1~~GHVT01049211.1.p1  ORF type:complete len:376 (+),score=51.60 GHVT01049211.1:925-2052(+)
MGAPLRVASVLVSLTTVCGRAIAGSGQCAPRPGWLWSIFFGLCRAIQAIKIVDGTSPGSPAVNIRAWSHGVMFALLRLAVGHDTMPTPCAKSVGPGGGADDDIRVRAASAPFELATSLPPGSEASPYVYSIPAGSDYPISLYECPPLGYRESLPKLQAATQHRKAILTFIDDCYGLSASSCYPESPALLTKLKELKLRLVAANLAVDSSALSSTPSKQTLNEVAALDAASHFLLRTAFSVDRQKSEWFIKQESRLLAFKWAAFLVGRKTKMLFKGQGEHAGTRDPVDEVFTKEGLIYPQLVNPTKAHLAKEQLHLWNYAVRGHIDERIPDKFYIVPALTDAPSLVRTRQVYVYANCAFLKLEDMERVLLTKFRYA